MISTRMLYAAGLAVVLVVGAGTAVNAATGTNHQGQPSSVASTSSNPTKGKKMDDKRAGAALWTTWVGIWNGDFDSAPKIVSQDFVVHTTLFFGSSSEAIRGPQGLTKWIAESRSAFADMTFTTEVGPIIDGKHIAGHWQATATYAGGIPGATVAPGTRIQFNGTDVLRVEGGKIVEYWLNTDTVGLFAELGIGAK